MTFRKHFLELHLREPIDHAHRGGLVAGQLRIELQEELARLDRIHHVGSPHRFDDRDDVLSVAQQG